MNSDKWRTGGEGEASVRALRLSRPHEMVPRAAACTTDTTGSSALMTALKHARHGGARIESAKNIT